MDKLFAPQWKAKQRATYLNTIAVTPDEDLGTLLSENIQQTFNDPHLLEGALYQRLLKIATPVIAKEILDALTYHEKRFLYGNFSHYMTELKKNNVKELDSNQFIAEVQRSSALFPFRYEHDLDRDNLNYGGFGGDDDGEDGDFDGGPGGGSDSSSSGAVGGGYIHRGAAGGAAGGYQRSSGAVVINDPHPFLLLVIFHCTLQKFQC